MVDEVVGAGVLLVGIVVNEESNTTETSVAFGTLANPKINTFWPLVTPTKQNWFCASSNVKVAFSSIRRV